MSGIVPMRCVKSSIVSMRCIVSSIVSMRITVCIVWVTPSILVRRKLMSGIAIHVPEFMIITEKVQMIFDCRVVMCSFMCCMWCIMSSWMGNFVVRSWMSVWVGNCMSVWMMGDGMSICVSDCMNIWVG